MAAQVSSITLDKQGLERFCRRHHIVRLSLFGSAARGELRTESDLDFLVEYEAGHRPGLVALQQIEDELSELCGGPAGPCQSQVPESASQGSNPGGSPATVCRRMISSLATKRASQIFRTQAGVPGNTSQDSAAQLLTIMEGKLVVGPPFTNEESVGAALALHVPADAFQRGQHAPGLSRRPVAH